MVDHAELAAAHLDVVELGTQVTKWTAAPRRRSRRLFEIDEADELEGELSQQTAVLNIFSVFSDCLCLPARVLSGKSPSTWMR